MLLEAEGDLRVPKDVVFKEHPARAYGLRCCAEGPSIWQADITCNVQFRNNRLVRLLRYPEEFRVVLHHVQRCSDPFFPHMLPRLSANPHELLAGSYTCYDATVGEMIDLVAFISVDGIAMPDSGQLLALMVVYVHVDAQPAV